MKHAPLRGLRCFPRESTGSMSGKCGWAFDMANLPGRSDVTRPVCADTTLATRTHPTPAPERGPSSAAAVRCPLQGPHTTRHLIRAAGLARNLKLQKASILKPIRCCRCDDVPAGLQASHLVRGGSVR
jgi:hypothetical protein